MLWAMSIDNPKQPSRISEPSSDVQSLELDVVKPSIRTTTAAPLVAVSAVKPAALPPPEKTFRYQSELDVFTKIKSKVFLTDQEKAERDRLTHDASLLRALGLHLTDSGVGKTSQDAAVDLLIEALKSGDKAMASEVAKAVIEDAQVENATLEQGVRENLAGIKAEVLYHWAAYMPEDAAGIERYLPGPVSQKIWSNVTRRHESNRAESREERK
jgi:hypothetical protein